MATDRLINKDQGDDIIDALSDIATNINTITYGPQTSADKVVSMTGYAKAGTADAISQGDTLNEAVGKLEKKADDNATAITGKTAGPESATVGDIATFNNVNGKVLNDSGISIQTSVDDTKDTEVPTSKAVGTFVSGKGYAIGVATSTANHLVTFNGTDGKALKDGGATIAFNTTGVLDDDTAVPTSKAVQSYVTGKHYAGSSSDGGAATSADKLNIGNSNIGSATQPVYFDKTTGKPVAITNTIQSNADAVFTDTTYTVATGTQNGKIKVTPSVGSAYEVPVYGLGNAAYKGVADTVSSSTDLVTSNAVNTKLASYVPNSDLVEVIDNGAKNIFDVVGDRGGWEFTPLTISGLTCVMNADGTFRVTGTPSTTNNITFSLYNLAGSNLQKYNGCSISGSSAISGNVTWAVFAFELSQNPWTPFGVSSNGVADTINNIPNDSSSVVCYLRVVCANTTTAVDVTFKPMVTPKAQFDISNEYEPHALGNQVITPELIELVDSGAKNVYNPSRIDNVPTGLTVTRESDGTTLKINGTYSGTGFAYIDVGTFITDRTGVYYLNVITTKTMSEDFIIYTNDGHLAGNSSYNYTTNPYTSVAIKIASGQTFNNVTVKILLCTKAAFGVSKAFVPYRLPLSDNTWVKSADLFPSHRTEFDVSNSHVYTYTNKFLNKVVVSIDLKAATEISSSTGVLSIASNIANIPPKPVFYDINDITNNFECVILKNNANGSLAFKVTTGTISSGTTFGMQIEYTYGFN